VGEPVLQYQKEAMGTGLFIADDTYAFLFSFYLFLAFAPQSYKVHHDFLQYNEEEVQQIGDRILTVFLYLNDVEEGGATSFPELNMTVLPKPGRALIWPNVLDSSPKEIDWSTEHEANNVTMGKKYGANVWFHMKPFRRAYTRYQCCETKRIYLENGPDAWESGDLDDMFQRIVQDPRYQDEYHTQVLSSPQMTDGSEADGKTTKPWIVMLENFLSSQETDQLIELGAQHGYMNSEMSKEESENDDNNESWGLPLISWCDDECTDDSVTVRVLKRISKLTELDQAYNEKLQFLKYERGQL
jgi:hypothetical protein